MPRMLPAPTGLVSCRKTQTEPSDRGKVLARRKREWAPWFVISKRPMAAESTHHYAARADPYVVLLVEDEFLIRCDLADELRLLGCQVIEAGNADEAIEVLRSTARIEVVVTDVRMPGMRDGVEVARVVRDERPGTRVIVTSGHFVPTDEHSNLIDLIVAKPVPSDLFAKQIVLFMNAHVAKPDL